MHQPISREGDTDIQEARATLPARLEALVSDGSDGIAAMANVAAVLKETFQWHWVGFYRVIGDELVLGPFQGPLACTRIAYGKGVCGTAWKEARTMVVPDVDRFPGHIACSPHSRSEIVVPLKDATGTVRAVLDVDSSELHGLGEEDARFLERVAGIIEPLL
jgi:L-methionine (R)-S-oxide reductase